MNRQRIHHRICAFCLALILAFSPAFQGIVGMGTVYAQEDNIENDSEDTEYTDDGEEQPEEDYYDTNSNADTQQEEQQTTPENQDQTIPENQEGEIGTIIESSTITDNEVTTTEETTEEEATTTEETTEEETTEEETTEEETTEEETTEEETTEEETEEEQYYIWLGMTDEEFVEWFTDEDNAEYIREIIMIEGQPTQEQIDMYDSIFAVIEAILEGDDEELAERLMMYLDVLMNYGIMTLDEATPTIRITYDPNGGIGEAYTISYYVTNISETSTTTTSGDRRNPTTVTTYTYTFSIELDTGQFKFPASTDTISDLETDEYKIPTFKGWATVADTQLASNRNNKYTEYTFNNDGKIIANFTITQNTKNTNKVFDDITLYALWNNFYTIKSTTDISNITDGAYYQLRSDVIGDKEFDTSESYVVDLNGYVWTGTGKTTTTSSNNSGNGKPGGGSSTTTTYKSVMEITTDNVKLIIVDSNLKNQSHKGTVNDNKLWTHNDSSGTVEITGGIITGGVNFQGGGIFCHHVSSTIIIHSGTLAGNQTYNPNNVGYAGAAISMGTGAKHSPTFKMTGGRICYNYSTYNGGGLYLKGTAVLTGGKIDNNYANNSGGGVRFTSQYNLTLTMENVTIADNIAKNGNGGGINISMGDSGETPNNSTVSISINDNNQIKNNEAGNYGGGISMTQYPGGTVSVTIDGENTLIQNNSSTKDGGGIYMESGTLTIKNGTISNNTTTKNGGGFALSKVTAKDSSGNIVEHDVSFIMKGGTISNNVAKENGGGGYISDGSAEIDGGSIVDNGVVIEDLAGTTTKTPTTVNGGGIYVSGGTVTMSGGSVKNNTATINGGGFCVVNGTVNIPKNSSTTRTISENTALCGGGISVENGNVNIGNTLEGDTESVGSNADNIYIKDNIATTSGGGIYVNGGSITVDEGNITSNTAINGGGVYLAKGEGGFTLKGGNITSNTAVNGGGVYLFKNPNLNAGNIDNNTATINITKLTEKNITISATSANGGGIYIENTKVELNPTGEVSISNNTANNGAGMYINGEEGKATETGFSVNTEAKGTISFSKNQASASDTDNNSGNGGGVCVSNGYFTLNKDNIIVQDNIAVNGGGIAVLSGTFTMSAGSIGADGNANIATNGGGVYVANGQATVEGGVVNYNTAIDGGGIYVAGGQAKVSGGNVQHNTATNGGGIYVSGGNSTISTESQNSRVNPDEYNVYISSGNVRYNTATNNGGGICVSNGYVLMDGGKIEYNTAQSENTDGGYGGAIYLTSAKDARVRVRSGEISYNTASKSGGAISVQGQKDSDITLTVIIGVNEEHDCKHTYLDYKNGTISPCPVIKNNSSVQSGGAIYISGGTNTILNIYCLEETNNTTSGDDGDSNFMMMEGGKVIISTGYEENGKYYNGEGKKGNIYISGTIHIVGGKMDIYGKMKNPKLDDVITVEVENDTDYFKDHRVRLEGEDAIYWVHYYENFPIYDEATGTTIRTGRYRAYPIYGNNGEYIHTIRKSVFEREGYVIKGWHTTPEGEDTDTITDNAYEVGETYYFPDVKKHTNKVTNDTEESDLIANTDDGESVSGSQLTTLVLYAIWDLQSYQIEFKANATSYNGTMDNMTCNIGQEYLLTANAYNVKNKQFIGWNTKKDGTGTSYPDEAKIKDLTTVNGGIVTLYAQWKDCDHIGKLVYIGEGNVITEICSVCGGHTAYATISAVSVNYDGYEHPASVTYSEGWMYGELEISYEMAADDKWDGLDSVDDVWKSNINSVPLHAGTYTASIIIPGSDSITATTIKTEDETDTITTIDDSKAIASTTYKIYRVKWETPDSPTITADYGGTQNKINKATITAPVGDGIWYYKSQTNSVTVSEESTLDGWQEEPTFNNFNGYNKFYYFFAIHEEDRDHIRSDPSKSLIYLATNGVVVNFVVDEGISLEVGSEGNEKLSFSVTTEDGYHYRNYNHADIDSIVVTKNDKAYDDKSELKLTETESSSISGNYSYVLEGLGETKYTGCNVTIYIMGAAKDVKVECKVKDGQIFRDFVGIDTVISKDSAFTTSFTVSNYIPDEYEKQALSFGTNLPKDTTIILKTDGEYYYYIVTDDDISIDLSSFTKMGVVSHKDSPFSYKKYSIEEPVSEKALDSFTYQFIVDFSQVAEDNRLTIENLTVDLEFVPSDRANSYKQDEQGVAIVDAVISNKAPKVPEENIHHLNIGIRNVAGFGLSASESNGTSGTLTATYTPSTGAASIWKGRKTALVLTAPNDIPSDLYLIVSTGGQTNHIYINSQHQFIIPLSTTLSTTGGSGSASSTDTTTVTICSDLFPEGDKTYEFTAQWYVSASEAGSSPLNGYMASQCYIQFTVKNDTSPSLRVDGDDRIFYVGKGSLKVTLSYQDLPSNAYIKAELLQKNSQGQYVAIGTSRTINGAGNTEISKISETYTLPQESGNMCLRYTVYLKEGGFEKNIMEVPYYFIILNEDGTISN